LDTCAEYLKTYEGNYRFLIQFRNSPHGIRVEKRGRELSLAPVQERAANKSVYDVIYTTRLPYLKWSLTIPYGDEVLFVGSGGVFEYTDRKRIKQNLHRELMHVLRRQSTVPLPRYGKSSRVAYAAKTAVKRLLGWVGEDLYDLEKWTVFHNGQAQAQSWK
jgi:hypothetical protein